ncbi:MAG: hypothetical protein GPJ54_14355 [Candidatus Heimdallarchaeota archaeon]|nr:hypothetical protein [Candidatus Heimdallarchaeota archaeon]
MRIIALSDIHDDLRGLEKLKQKQNLANIDLILVAGDLTDEDPRRVLAALNAFDNQIIIVRGNHDPTELGNYNNITELKYGDTVSINGISIMGIPYPYVDHDVMGSPIEAEFQSTLERSSDEIYNPDIILSHAPPFGFFDWINDDTSKQYGSHNLRNYIKSNSPKLVICGHIHVSGGKTGYINETLVLNVAIFNEEHSNGGSYFEINYSSDNIDFERKKL